MWRREVESQEQGWKSSYKTAASWWIELPFIYVLHMVGGGRSFDQAGEGNEGDENLL